MLFGCCCTSTPWISHVDGHPLDLAVVGAGVSEEAEEKEEEKEEERKERKV